MKTRITITCQDDLSFDFIQKVLLVDIIDNTHKTGQCLIRSKDGISCYAQKTKAGYKMNLYEDKQ